MLQNPCRLEILLAAITAAGWFTRLVEVNGTLSDAEAPPSRCWQAELYHPGAIRKFGYGPSAFAAITAAWETDEVHEDSLYLRHPDPDRPAVDLSSLGLAPSVRPVLRRI